MAEEKQSAQEILAGILLRQEQEKAEAKQAEDDKKARRREQTKKDEADNAALRFERQKRCDHLMGNHIRGRQKPHIEIPDLSLHTYSNGKSRIRCNRCGFIWTPKTTAEKAFDFHTAKPLEVVAVNAKGAKSNNPTGMSWKDAYDMQMQNQTLGNKPGRAFRVVKIQEEEFV